MNLYLYDSKHERILDQMPVKDSAEVEKIIAFLDKNGLTSRYKTLVIANNYRQVEDDDGFSEIVFKYENP